MDVSDEEVLEASANRARLAALLVAIALLVATLPASAVLAGAMAALGYGALALLPLAGAVVAGLALWGSGLFAIALHRGWLPDREARLLAATSLFAPSLLALLAVVGWATVGAAEAPRDIGLPIAALTALAIHAGFGLWAASRGQRGRAWVIDSVGSAGIAVSVGFCSAHPALACLGPPVLVGLFVGTMQVRDAWLRRAADRGDWELLARRGQWVHPVLYAALSELEAGTETGALARAQQLCRLDPEHGIVRSLAVLRALERGELDAAEHAQRSTPSGLFLARVELRIAAGRTHALAKQLSKLQRGLIRGRHTSELRAAYSAWIAALEGREREARKGLDAAVARARRLAPYPRAEVLWPLAMAHHHLGEPEADELLAEVAALGGWRGRRATAVRDARLQRRSKVQVPPGSVH